MTIRTMKKSAQKIHIVLLSWLSAYILNSLQIQIESTWVEQTD